MTGGLNIEWWHAAIGLTVFAVSAILNLVTFSRYMSRALRAHGYFPGRWQGVLKHPSGELHCVMVLYLEDGELTGQVYYEGRYEDRENVMGFDLLQNDSRDFRCTKRAFGVIGQTYEARFRRSVDSFRQNGDRVIDNDTLDYIYHFDVQKRFRHKRIVCSVETKGLDGFDALTFTGELARAK